MSLLKFPAPEAEHYTIDYDPVTHAVDIPLVPDDVMGAVCITDRWVRELIESGTLDADELNMVFLNATGQLGPKIFEGGTKS